MSRRDPPGKRSLFTSVASIAVVLVALMAVGGAAISVSASRTSPIDIPTTGPSGDVGPAGSAGPSGPAGPSATTGAVGATGATGAKGSTGAEGLPGTMGAQGDLGATGSQGAPGNPGAQGEFGTAGTTGATGSGGTTGAAGAQGKDGAGGATGAKGDQGIQGEPGPQGVAGKTRAQAAAKDSNETRPQSLENGSWLVTGSATLQSGSDESIADCQVTVEIAGSEPTRYPIVFKKMAASEIESFTSAILVSIGSAETAAATASCAVEKTSTQILNLTISAVEIESSKR